MRKYDPIADYMNDVLILAMNYPDDLICDLDNYVQGIGVQNPPTMMFFPNEEDKDWPVGKPFETVGFDSEFDDEIYYISYQELYDMLCAVIERGIQEHSEEVKSEIRTRLNAFKEKHRLT